MIYKAPKSIKNQGACTIIELSLVGLALDVVN